jgi:isopenicillin N synthase-like dioxygenase
MLQIDFKSNCAPRDFNNSLLETGFAVIRNHPIDYDLVRDVFSEWADFFASSYKNNYLYKEETQDGLFPISTSETAVGYSIKDIKEFYHYYPWGQYPKELSNKTKDLYLQMTAVAKTLLQWTEGSLPAEIRNKLSQPLTHMIDNSSNHLMRILHYPALTGYEEAEAVRAGAHTDINLLTVLVAASSSGLQVKNTKGQWLDVPVDPGMLSINVGDMLQEATNGFYKSTIHQVINPIQGSDANHSRYSIPRSDVVLSDRYTAGSFLHERLVELGIKKSD